MCNPALIPLAAAAISAGAQVYSANKQASAAKDAAAAQQAAQTPAIPQTQQAKAPSADTNNLAAGIGTGTNNLGAANFSSNTLLTGPDGVTDPLTLSARRLYGGQNQTSGLLGA